MTKYDLYWWKRPIPVRPWECSQCWGRQWVLWYTKGANVCSICTGHQKAEDIFCHDPVFRIETADQFICQQIRQLQKLWGPDLHPDLLQFLDKFGHPASPNSDWIGEEKQRTELDVVFVSREGPFDGDYGESFKYLFLHEGKNRLVWFTKATNWIDECSPGTPFKIKATFGEHKEFKGIKETMIKRVRKEIE